MTPAPKRRWFRYSLRTLFVVVTVFGCWLGYELNWIRQRHELLAEQSAIIQQLKLPPMPYFIVEPHGMLWLFGEEGRGIVDLVLDGRDQNRSPNTENELERAKRLFPESAVNFTVIRDLPASNRLFAPRPPAPATR